MPFRPEFNCLAEQMYSRFIWSVQAINTCPRALITVSSWNIPMSYFLYAGISQHEKKIQG